MCQGSLVATCPRLVRLRPKIHKKVGGIGADVRRRLTFERSAWLVLFHFGFFDPDVCRQDIQHGHEERDRKKQAYTKHSRRVDTLPVIVGDLCCFNHFFTRFIGQGRQSAQARADNEYPHPQIHARAWLWANLRRRKTQLHEASNR